MELIWDYALVRRWRGLIADGLSNEAMSELVLGSVADRQFEQKMFLV